MDSITKRNFLIAAVSAIISIVLCNYMYDNCSKDQMILVLASLIASTSYMAINEVCEKIDQCRKK